MVFADTSQNGSGVIFASKQVLSLFGNFLVQTAVRIALAHVVGARIIQTSKKIIKAFCEAHGFVESIFARVLRRALTRTWGYG
jgi:hypothetical protein